MCVLGPNLFHLFIDGLDEGVVSPLTGFADGARLGAVAIAGVGVAFSRIWTGWGCGQLATGWRSVGRSAGFCTWGLRADAMDVGWGMCGWRAAGWTWVGGVIWQ